MSYHFFEVDGINFTDEEQFRKNVCGTCYWEMVCKEWEFKTGQTLYSNVGKGGEPHVSFDGKVTGVYRCADYAPEEEG